MNGPKAVITLHPIGESSTDVVLRKKSSKWPNLSVEIPSVEGDGAKSATNVVVRELDKLDHIEDDQNSKRKSVELLKQKFQKRENKLKKEKEKVCYKVLCI